MGDWKLKFFEKGTEERVTKSGHRTGRIRPRYFFRAARENSGLVLDTIKQVVESEIAKLNK